MLNALRLQASNPAALHCCCEVNGALVSSRRRLSLRLPTRRHFASFTCQSLENASSEPSDSSRFTSTVGFSSAIHLYPSTITYRHIQVLSFFACAAGIFATWLFCSAIPTLLAFKRAAESLEKLMDATREELPDTMAAVRLSGMEISDLTMELSDLGQEITQGVRSSTRAVRLAEERLRRLTNMNPIVSVQELAPTKSQIADPFLARSARSIREGIVKGRAVLQMVFTLTQYSKILLKYLTSH
ncbi:hypothetical protein PHJA_001877000 [Phtheirospermum japonicum]|uniref:Uncharacterized protein n=1 Tax=Phtheirospermum japonicum TaxID=374723 RepID=A0A830CE82_9LAMI|nr:hypothetical protein PHJA_001877000 [Phtheirospermum japonicum]